MGQTEARMPLFEYTPFDFSVTEEVSNLDIEGAEALSRSQHSSTNRTN
jgi:hypothetical protein